MRTPINLILLFSFIQICSQTIPAVNAATYEVIKVESGERLEGTIVYNGSPPAPKMIHVNKDPDICGKGKRIIDQVIVSSTSQGGLLNAVVFLEGVTKGKKWSEQTRRPFLKQKGCRFTPEIIVTRKKGVVNLLNKDPLIHNIHAFESIDNEWRTLFNHSQSPKEDRIPQRVRPKSAGGIKVVCDIHNFMQAWIFSAENPYFAISNNDGYFSINEIPTGKYKVKVWHPVLGTKDADVKIGTNQITKIDFVYSDK